MSNFKIALILGIAFNSVVFAQTNDVDITMYPATGITNDVEIDIKTLPITFYLDEESIELTINDFITEDSSESLNSTYDFSKIYKLFPNINKNPIDPKIELINNQLKVTDEQVGVRINLDDLKSQIDMRIANHNNDAIYLKYTITPPHASAEEFNEFLPQLELMISENLSLNSENEKFIFNTKDNFKALNNTLSYYLELDNMKIPVSLITKDETAKKLLKKDWILNINRQDLGEFIKTNLSEKLEKAPKDVTITMNEEGVIDFEGTATNGVKIDIGKLTTKMINALNSEEKDVEIPLKEEFGIVNAPDELKKRGIKELIAVGYSDFRGSTWKRIHNIKTGIAIYNGLIIPKNEVFSFNDNLGPVDSSTGYMQELVIKGDKTIPEYGGGLCQVSSTFFRAGLFGGLAIPERSPHSYAVSYYARPGGHGLDCTIYPGVKDCKIQNDTPADILIQSYTDGTNAYFKFYGTSDHRKIKLEGPFYSNRRGAPATKTIYNPSYSTDYSKVEEGAHNGFDTTWYRTVTLEDGAINKETFFSHYQARPKVITRGGEKPTE